MRGRGEDEGGRMMLGSVRKEIDKEEKKLGKEVSCWLIGESTSVDW